LRDEGWDNFAGRLCRGAQNRQGSEEVRLSPHNVLYDTAMGMCVNGGYPQSSKVAAQVSACYTSDENLSMKKLLILSLIVLLLGIVSMCVYARRPEHSANSTPSTTPSRPPNHDLINNTASSTPTIGSNITKNNSELFAQQSSSLDKSELDLAVGNVAIPMITDPDGLRTGRDAATNVRLEEIPKSTYFEDSVNTDTGKEVSHFIQVMQPKTGRYLVRLTGLHAGGYELSIRAFLCFR